MLTRDALRAQSQPVTDADRRKLEAALLAALILIYLARMRQLLDFLGLISLHAVISDAAESRLKEFAAERAQKIQDGINESIAETVAALPDDATDGDQQAALAQAQNEIHRYNGDVLIPFMVATASYRALVDTYQSTPSNVDGKSLADLVEWTWTQNTDFVDDCTDAEAASPTSLDELFAITGGPPPVHQNCQCDLSAGSAAGFLPDASQ